MSQQEVARFQETLDRIGVLIQMTDSTDPIFPDMTAEEIETKIRASRRFAWIKRPVTPRQRQQIMDLVPAEPALRFGRRDARVYPAGRLAAHILGGVKTGDERVGSAELIGSAGIELAFDGRLRGQEGPAGPLALSIDLAAQAALTEVLAEGIARNGALRGSGILMDVRTGEILAMAALPDFDPNAPVTKLDGGLANPRFNQPVKGVYELGSVFKVVTAAIALETGLVEPETRIETGTPLRAGRRRIRDMHRMPAYLPVTDIVRRSSNVGSARLALMVGTDGFRDYLDRLGLLAPLDLALPEARSARPIVPDPWRQINTMTISFGHGLAVSPLHLLSAYATIANGGRKVTPSLVKGGGVPGERVFSEETARQMLDILRLTVERGTGRRTDVPGYEVGGKTGTADKPRPGGGYYSNKVLASFASVFPTSDPKYAMLILLDEPTDPETGRREASRTAVPVTAEAIRRIAPLLGLRPIPDADEAISMMPGIPRAMTVGLGR